MASGRGWPSIIGMKDATSPSRQTSATSSVKSSRAISASPTPVRSFRATTSGRRSSQACLPPQPEGAVSPLLQLDGDSIGGPIGSVLLCVRRGTGRAHVVCLRAGLVVQVHDDAIQDVLVRRALLVGLIVDAEDAHVLVLEDDLVVP